MTGLELAWPYTLLGLRVAAVAALYLFLFSAFRALRGELRSEARPVAVVAPVDSEQAVAVRPPGVIDWPGRPRPAETAFPDVAEDEAAPPRSPRRIPASIAIPGAAAILVVVLGSVAVLAMQGPAGDVATITPSSTTTPSGPPAVTPAPGRVTVGLAAVEDSQVRVTVDGVVQFDGTLRAGQQQSWEGGERIQVWTDTGKTLQLAVNGEDLGPYSPAMGHPEWNRIDFGFWPGWAR